MKLDMDKYKKRFRKFSRTKQGQNTIVVGAICFFAGMFWKLLFIIALTIGVGYILYNVVVKKNESKEKA